MVLPKPSPPDTDYREVLNAPEHLVAEILDGTLHLSPRPRRRHGKVEKRLGFALRGFDDPEGPDDPGGWVIELEPEPGVGS